MSQTLCNIEVLPAFALPMMSTLNWTFGARGLGAGARDGAGDGDGAGTGAGEGDGTGAGAGAGPKQQISCFTRIARKCCERERRDNLNVLITRCNPTLVIIHTVQTSAEWCACNLVQGHAVSFHGSDLTTHNPFVGMRQQSGGAIRTVVIK